LVLVRGEATEEEVAALVAVLSGVAAASAAASAGAGDAAPASEWAGPHRKVRTAYPHGPGGWRASALPR
jgi:hypothetical protein